MDKSRLVQITRQSKIAEDEFYPMIAFMYEQVWQNLLPTQILTEGLTTRAASNVITPVDAPVPDCMTCGACCASMLCVGVRPAEEKEISAGDYWDIVVEGENGEILVDRYLQRNAETFACTALDGTIGEKVGCRIYENRPRICHLFEAGSDKCHALRRAYGLEPFLTLPEMSEAVQKLKMLPERHLPSEKIRHVKFVEQSEGALQISATMTDGAIKTIHVFNPKRETWRQFEFDGLTLAEAENLVKSRVPEAGEKPSKI